MKSAPSVLIDNFYIEIFLYLPFYLFYYACTMFSMSFSGPTFAILGMSRMAQSNCLFFRRNCQKALGWNYLSFKSRVYIHVDCRLFHRGIVSTKIDTFSGNFWMQCFLFTIIIIAILPFKHIFFIYF